MRRKPSSFERTPPWRGCDSIEWPPGDTAGGGASHLSALRTFWRTGLKAAAYLIAFGIIAGGALIAVGILLLAAAAFVLGGGILVLAVGLALALFWNQNDDRTQRPV